MLRQDTCSVYVARRFVKPHLVCMGLSSDYSGQAAWWSKAWIRAQPGWDTILIRIRGFLKISFAQSKESWYLCHDVKSFCLIYTELFDLCNIIIDLQKLFMITLRCPKLDLNSRDIYFLLNNIISSLPCCFRVEFWTDISFEFLA